MTPLLARFRTQLQFLIALLYVGLLYWTGWYLSRPDGPEHRQLYPSQPIQMSADGTTILMYNGTILRMLDGVTLCNISPGYKMTLSYNGHLLAAQYEDHITVIQTFPAGKSFRIAIQRSSVESFAINTAGTLLAVGGNSLNKGSLLIFDIHTGTLIQKLDSDGLTIDSLQFTPDDKWLLVGGWRSDRVYATKTWRNVLTINGQGGEWLVWGSNQVARRVERNVYAVTMSDETSVKITDDVLEVPYYSLQGQKFSANGAYLIAVRDSIKPVAVLVGMLPDGDAAFFPIAMTLVRTADGAVVQRFAGPRGVLSNPTFTPDGRWIVTIGPGPGLTYWPIHPREPWEQELRALPMHLAPLPLLLAIGAWAVRRWRRRGR